MLVWFCVVLFFFKLSQTAISFHNIHTCNSLCTSRQMKQRLQKNFAEHKFQKIPHFHYSERVLPAQMQASLRTISQFSLKLPSLCSLHWHRTYNYPDSLSSVTLFILALSGGCEHNTSVTESVGGNFPHLLSSLSFKTLSFLPSDKILLCTEKSHLQKQRQLFLHQY